MDLKAQFAAYESGIRTQVEEVTQSTLSILGPKGEELERKIAAFTGARYAFVCSSGTNPLRLALMALGVRRGDGLTTTPFTSDGDVAGRICCLRNHGHREHYRQ